MNINTIAKATIKEITHKRNSTLTPLLYFEIFCKEAQKLNLKIEDCELVSHYKEKLNPTFKEHADKYNIRHINELITFLIGNLNRLNLNQLQERHFSLVDLLTKILRTHEILDHNGVKELSRKTNALLERVHTAKDLDSMRNEWVHLIVLSKESYKDKLKKFVNIEKDDDIDSITEKIIPLLEKEKRCKHIDNLIKLIFYSIEPSLTNSNQENYKELHEQVEKLKNVLDKDPYQIYNLRVQEKVEELFEKRIDFDKGQELKTVKEFNHIIETMLTSMNKTFESQDPVQKNIDEVKQYLKELKDNSFNEEKKNSIFETLNSKIDELSGHKTNFFSNIKEYTNKLFDMGEKIKNLEKELKKSQKNENTDHLTKINNKRALDQYSHDLDARYRRYQENFSMVVMDLDYLLVLELDILSCLSICHSMMIISSLTKRI